MPPLFFIGSSPSMAARIISQDHPAAGVMVSVTQLSRRRSDFVVDDWIMDSGAFTEVARHGGYRRPVEWYFQKVLRWAKCGNLLAAVSQDWMCEGFVLKRTGLSIKEHQRLTIERYDALVHLAAGSLSPPIMPVLQGYSVSDYLVHVDQYGARLAPGSWVGIGSVCRRNGAPEQVRDILRAVKNKRSDLRLHGFGLKHTSLESPEVRELLYSCDSMAWSYPRRFSRSPGESLRNRAALRDIVQKRPHLEDAFAYQALVDAALSGASARRVPRTAGAGNGQGRKPKWRHGPTVVIRVPSEFADCLIDLARKWDDGDSQVFKKRGDKSTQNKKGAK